MSEKPCGVFSGSKGMLRWEDLPVDALGEIAKAGGLEAFKTMRQVCKTWQAGFDSRVVQLTFRPIVKEVTFSKLSNYPALSILDLEACPWLQDVHLEYLEGLRLRVLSLKSTGITDAGLKSLEGMQLTSLSLNGCHLTGAGLQLLCAMPLTLLSLSR